MIIDNVDGNIYFFVGQYQTRLTAIRKICGHDLKELEPLKYVCSVRMGERMFESSLTEAQKELLERIGIGEEDVGMGK